MVYHQGLFESLTPFYLQVSVSVDMERFSL